MDPAVTAMHVAAGLHYGVDATCGSKIDFRSEDTAVKSAVKLTEKYGREMEGYPCGFCNGWHVGRRLTDEEVARFTKTC